MKTSDRSPAAVFALQHQHRHNPDEPAHKLRICSEEKARSLLEALIYFFLIWIPLVAILKFADYRAVVSPGADKYVSIQRTEIC